MNNEDFLNRKRKRETSEEKSNNENEKNNKESDIDDFDIKYDTKNIKMKINPLIENENKSKNI